MIGRLVIAWLGVIPLALLAAMVTWLIPWTVLGFPLAASLMLLAYIGWSLWWTGLYAWSASSVEEQAR